MRFSARVPRQLLPNGFAPGLCVAAGCPRRRCGSPLAGAELCDALEAICSVVIRLLPEARQWVGAPDSSCCDLASFSPSTPSLGCSESVLGAPVASRTVLLSLSTAYTGPEGVHELHRPGLCWGKWESVCKQPLAAFEGNGACVTLLSASAWQFAITFGLLG